MGSGIKLGAYIPALDREEIEKNLKPLFVEYFENSELEECISAIIKFNIGTYFMKREVSQLKIRLGHIIILLQGL